MRPRFSLVVLLFLVSGSTGLLYEVAFGKLLGYVFGATAYAISTVLASFMGGLALGAHIGGKHAAKLKKPLAAYGVLEILVGLVCAVSPVALEALTRVYVQLAQKAPDSLATITALRATMAVVIVIVPTVAMGATLPILSRVVAGETGPGSARRLSILYAINTAGGALGALTSAYAILPALGVRGTIWAAAIANMVIGTTALVAGLRSADATHETIEVKPSDVKPSEVKAVVPTNAADRESTMLTFAFASGFVVFAAEVVETHLLALLIGNSAYAFGLMLAVFLVCLAIGAARAHSFAERHGDRAIALGLGAAALSLAITMPLWAELPRLFLFAGKHVHSWAGREIVRAIAALVILIVPTVFLGTTFPLLLSRVAAKRDVASRVGRLTVANTVGTIAGSILTGYFVLPLLGSQGSLMGVTALLAIAAIAAYRAFVISSPNRARQFVLPAVATLIVLVAPKWDMARLTNGANVYFSAGPPPDSIERVWEDVHGGVTSVARRGDVLTMYTNGKFQGDNGPEMPAQRRFAHFPSMFVKNQDRVLVIGLGTGTTLGTITAYPWKHIEVAEISPSIVEASRLFFSGPARSSLGDPRVSLSLADGRNHLLVSPGNYDLVTMELTSVWFAGASSLYSREFYGLVRSRLAPGGILQQWVQLHHIRRQELAAIVRTLREEFPHVALFVGGAQGILIAANEPLVASRARLEQLSKEPAIAETMGGASMFTLFDELVASEQELDRFVSETPGERFVSTDDNLFLEYATPKGNVLNYHHSLRETLDMLNQYKTASPEARHIGP